MSLLLAFIAGIVAYRFLARPLGALLRAALFVASVVAAARIAGALLPDLDYRGLAGGAGVGLLLSLTIVGGWFYVLGWRGRVAATEADDIKRARDKATKDRAVG